MKYISLLVFAVIVFAMAVAGYYDKQAAEDEQSNTWLQGRLETMSFFGKESLSKEELKKVNSRIYENLRKK